MTVQELIKNRRSIRRFEQKPIDKELLLEFVDAARLAPSAANMQPLRFRIVHDHAEVKAVFAHTKWAGYLPDFNPSETEAPAAFIAICIDTSIKDSDELAEIGAAAQNVFLSALERGIGGCWLGAINRPEICRILNIEPPIKLHSLLALGYPAESSEPAKYTDSIKYYYQDDVLQVPKRSLEDVLL